jgi:hypothetical protein
MNLAKQGYSAYEASQTHNSNRMGFFVINRDCCSLSSFLAVSNTGHGHGGSQYNSDNNSDNNSGPQCLCSCLGCSTVGC